MLLFWLTTLFASFTLFSPVNQTSIAALVVVALCASAALLLIFEMQQPFSGIMQVPSRALSTALPPLPPGLEPQVPDDVAHWQTLDTRQFQINGALALEVKATASGLVPELDQLLDLDAMTSPRASESANTTASPNTTKPLNTASRRPPAFHTAMNDATPSSSHRNHDTRLGRTPWRTIA